MLCVLEQSKIKALLDRNIKMKNKANITTPDEILDGKYGKEGLVAREQWEQEFEAFSLGVLLEQARIKLGTTQKELAKKN